MSRPAPDFRSDTGAALVTVLIMLTIIATLAILIVEAARSGILRTANQEQMEQSRWYLLGAESYAASKIATLASHSGASIIGEEPWQGRSFTYPLDEGVMTLRLRDGSNCFNLNSVVERNEDDALVASARGLAQFVRLLDLRDIGSGVSLAASLADWIDTDKQASPNGAEDEAFAGVAAPYRTANALIADLAELRRVRGFTEETIRTIEPFVCVRPTEAPNGLNINTLLPDQAPLLAMLIPGLSISTAREIISSRPRGGWDHVDAFLTDPRMAALEVSVTSRAQLAVQSRYYVLAARVERSGIAENSLALIDAGGRPRVVRRIFGAGASEHLM